MPATAPTDPGVKTRYPFDAAFYASLLGRRDDFRLVHRETVPAGRGHAFRVEAGQAFRLVTLERAQIVDTSFWNADDPTEHYASGAQCAIEGLQITRLTRVWGTPPNSRPLATVTADTLRVGPKRIPVREHAAHGAQCNPHLWAHFAGTHPRTCYDNFRGALATVGLSQRWIIDNMNLFQNTALDPHTGDYLLGRGYAEKDDYIEFYAEIPLLVAISICPAGGGDTIESPDDWGSQGVALYPMGIEILDTGVEPLGWPY